MQHLPRFTTLATTHNRLALHHDYIEQYISWSRPRSSQTSRRVTVLCRRLDAGGVNEEQPITDAQQMSGQRELSLPIGRNEATNDRYVIPRPLKPSLSLQAGASSIARQRLHRRRVVGSVAFSCHLQGRLRSFSPNSDVTITQP